MQKDKQKAKSHSWRIPEATLLLTALLGGSLGALLAMCIFHHKTKHPQFSIGIPLMLLAQITILILFLT